MGLQLWLHHAAQPNTFTTSMGLRKTLDTSDAMPAAHPRCQIVSSLSAADFSSPLPAAMAPHTRSHTLGYLLSRQHRVLPVGCSVYLHRNLSSR
jgi:hypothetical protein